MAQTLRYYYSHLNTTSNTTPDPVSPLILIGGLAVAAPFYGRRYPIALVGANIQLVRLDTDTIIPNTDIARRTLSSGYKT